MTDCILAKILHPFFPPIVFSPLRLYILKILIAEIKYKLLFETFPFWKSKLISYNK